MQLHTSNIYPTQYIVLPLLNLDNIHYHHRRNIGSLVTYNTIFAVQKTHTMSLHSHFLFYFNVHFVDTLVSFEFSKQAAVCMNVYQ